MLPRTLGKEGATIHVVAQPDGWVLHRWADRWAKEFCSVSSSVPNVSYMVNLFINYYQYKPTTTFDVAYFTHREARDKHLIESFDRVARECDLCIAQCEVTKATLLEVTDLEPDNIPVVYPGTDEQFKRIKKVGVIGKNHPSGRKRFNWLEAIDIPGIDIRTYEDVPYKNMHKVYEEIDYLLVTAEREGGPMPVAEAIDMGVPVIMPEGVGWYGEVPCYTYKDLFELGDLLKRLSGWITWEESGMRMRRAIESHF